MRHPKPISDDPIEALFARVPQEKLRFDGRVASEARARHLALRSTFAGSVALVLLLAAFLVVPRGNRGSFLPPDQVDAYVTGITSMTPSFADVAVKEETED